MQEFRFMNEEQGHGARGNAPPTTADANNYATDLMQYFQENVQDLLELNEEIREIMLDESDINPSTIIAVGDQSHGKSSVIEALSGILLPRGGGMTTRMPLVLHLCNTKGEEEYAKLRVGRNGQERIFPLEAVPAEISRATSERLGDREMISDEELHLWVYRRNQINLVLIDLPGMTRIGAVEDIEDRIVRMYERYINAPASVLLNVVSEQTDSANSRALQMSLEADQLRQRTILVLTKIDESMREPRRLAERIMRDIDSFRLQSGNVFCVRNRSLEESERNMGLEEANDLEREYFNDPDRHALLSRYARLGRDALAERLSQVQRDCILRTFPDLISTVESQLGEVDKELENLPIVADARVYSRELGNRVDTFLTALGNSQNGISNRRDGGEMVLLRINVDPARNASPYSAEDERYGLQAQAVLTPERDQRTTLGVTATWGNPRVPFQVRSVNFNVSAGHDETIFSGRVEGQGANGAISLNGRIRPFEILVIVTITREEPDTEGHATLHAQVTQCSELFARITESQHTTGSIFTSHFINTLREYLRHEGEEEPSFPGALTSRPIRRMALNLQGGLYAEAEKFLTQVTRAVTEWTRDIMMANIHEANLRNLLLDETETFIRECQRNINMEDLQAEFDLISVQRTEFKSKLQEIRQQLHAALADKGQLGEITSNHARDGLGETLDGLARLAAYWDVTKKEFNSHVIRTVRLHLASERHVEQLGRRLRGWIDTNEGILLELMGPSPEQVDRRQFLERRRENLANTIDRINNFISQRR